MDALTGFKNGKAGSALTIRVSTRASKPGIIGILEDGIVKVRLSAAPVDGKANDELIKLLSKIMKVPKGNVEIIAGETNKTKIVAIYGIDSDRVNQILFETIDLEG
jgi:uncharacterized protein